VAIAVVEIAAATEGINLTSKHLYIYTHESSRNFGMILFGVVFAAEEAELFYIHEAAMLPAAFAPDALNFEAAFKQDALGGDIAIGAVGLDAVDIVVVECPTDDGVRGFRRIAFAPMCGQQVVAYIDVTV
jgi:hypothetical protein